jgi:hypothetical protein
VQILEFDTDRDSLLVNAVFAHRAEIWHVAPSTADASQFFTVYDEGRAPTSKTALRLRDCPGTRWQCCTSARLAALPAKAQHARHRTTVGLLLCLWWRQQPCVCVCTWSPGGRYRASLWSADPETPKLRELAELKGAKGVVRSVLWGPGEAVVSIEEGLLRSWQLAGASAEVGAPGPFVK